MVSTGTTSARTAASAERPAASRRVAVPDTDAAEGMGLRNPAVTARLSPLSRWLNTRADDIIEISVNYAGAVFVVREGKPKEIIQDAATKREITIEWAWDLCSTLANVTGRAFSKRLPILDCKLPGGHRFAALLGPNVVSGIAISIRVRRDLEIHYEDFGFTPDQQEYLRALIRSNGSFLISAGTGSGKTALLNRMCTEIDLSDRIVSIQDVEELRLPHADWVSILVSRTDTGTDVEYSHVIDKILRLYPKRIPCGEISVHNSIAVLRLLNTGHGGFGGTIHANSPLDALDAWARNVEMADKSANGNAAIQLLGRSLEAIIQIEVLDERVQLSTPDKNGRPRFSQRRVATIAKLHELPWQEFVRKRAGAI